MARSNNRKVNINVDESFFKNIFEPERKKLSMRLGVNITQTAFTNFLSKSGARIIYPKLKMPKQNIKGKFGPQGYNNFGGVPFSI